MENVLRVDESMEECVKNSYYLIIPEHRSDGSRHFCFRYSDRKCTERKRGSKKN